MSPLCHAKFDRDLRRVWAQEPSKVQNFVKIAKLDRILALQEQQNKHIQTKFLLVSVC